MAREHRPIAVHGLGVAAPPGFGRPAFWDGVLTGRTNVRPIASFDASQTATDLAGWFPDDSPLPPIGSAERLPVALRAVVDEACAAAGWDARDDVAIVVGTTDVAGPTFELGFERGRLDSRALPATLAAEVAAACRIGGPVLATCSASATGGAVIGLALDLLRSGVAERVVAAAGDTITRASYFGLNSLRTLSPRGCQPFSKSRRGIRISEGAAAVALEAATASTDVVVGGFGASGLARSLARPDPDGIRLAIEHCLDDAGVRCDRVEYVNLHGPGTRHGDRAEIDALTGLFGDTLPAIALGSSKPVLGHGQAAAGLLELVVTVLALEHGQLPATHDLADVEPDWAHLDFVPRSRDTPLQVALTLSSGLGGLNTAVLLARQEAIA